LSKKVKELERIRLYVVDIEAETKTLNETIVEKSRLLEEQILRVHECELHWEAVSKELDQMREESR
jgi:hypothetical protein